MLMQKIINDDEADVTEMRVVGSTECVDVLLTCSSSST